MNRIQYSTYLSIGKQLYKLVYDLLDGLLKYLLIGFNVSS